MALPPFARRGEHIPEQNLNRQAMDKVCRDHKRVCMARLSWWDDDFSLSTELMQYPNGLVLLARPSLTGRMFGYNYNHLHLQF